MEVLEFNRCISGKLSRSAGLAATRRVPDRGSRAVDRSACTPLDQVAGRALQVSGGRSNCSSVTSSTSPISSTSRLTAPSSVCTTTFTGSSISPVRGKCESHAQVDRRDDLPAQVDQAPHHGMGERHQRQRLIADDLLDLQARRVRSIGRRSRKCSIDGCGHGSLDSFMVRWSLQEIGRSLRESTRRRR